jgi:hypothetical protein
MKPFHKTFWHVKVGDVDRDSPLFIYDPIKGTMKIHSIYIVNKNNPAQLLMTDLACYSEFCLGSCWSECQNVKWTSKWIPKQLQPQDTHYVQEAMYEGWDGDLQYGLQGVSSKCITIPVIGLFDEVYFYFVFVIFYL